MNKSWISGVLAVLAGLTLPAAAVASSFGRVTHVSAVGSAWAPVVLDEPLRVARGGFGQAPSGDPRATFSVSRDGGSFAAVQLRAVDPLSDGRYPTLVGYSTGGETDTVASDNILPAGAYQLYSFTDGVGVSATLELLDYSGERAVRLEAPLEKIRVSNQGTSGGGPFTTRIGDSLDLDRAAFLRVDLRLANASGPTRVEVCNYTTASDAPDAYDMGCPGGSSTGVQTYPGPRSADSCCVRFAEFNVLPGSVGWGGNVTGTGPREASLFMEATLLPRENSLPLMPAQPSKPAPSRWLSLRGLSVHKSLRKLRVRVTCLDATPCAGSFRSQGRKRTIHVPARGSLTLDVALTARNRRDLRKRGRARIKIEIAGVDGGGNPRVTTKIIHAMKPARR